MNELVPVRAPNCKAILSTLAINVLEFTFKRVRDRSLYTQVHTQDKETYCGQENSAITNKFIIKARKTITIRNTYKLTK